MEPKQEKISRMAQAIKVKIATINNLDVDCLSCYTFDNRYADGGERQRIVEELRKALYKAESAAFRLETFKTK